MPYTREVLPVGGERDEVGNTALSHEERCVPSFVWRTDENGSAATEKYDIASRLPQKRKRVLDVALVRGCSIDGLRGR